MSQGVEGGGFSPLSDPTLRIVLGMGSGVSFESRVLEGDSDATVLGFSFIIAGHFPGGRGGDGLTGHYTLSYSPNVPRYFKEFQRRILGYSISPDDLSTEERAIEEAFDRQSDEDKKILLEFNKELAAQEDIPVMFILMAVKDPDPSLGYAARIYYPRELPVRYCLATIQDGFRQTIRDN